VLGPLSGHTFPASSLRGDSPVGRDLKPQSDMLAVAGFDAEATALVPLREEAHVKVAAAKPDGLRQQALAGHAASHTARPWAGWTRKESEHTARALAEQRSGEPPRSSAAYPLAGLYDSADPEVAEWHVRLAQAAGIDAFLVDWWGTHLGRDKNIDKGILVAAEKHHFKFALFDERSQFHTD